MCYYTRVYDKNHYVAEFGKQKIRLSRTEYRLLAVLMGNPGKIFSKERLFSLVWDSEMIGDIGTVPVHIRKLRKKLGSENACHIETVWGMGYCYREK